MGAKLIKHEAIRTGPALGVILAVAAGLVVLGTAAARLGLPVISVLGYGLAVLASVAVIPVVQFYLAADFYRSSFRRTGYFTQTLPIAGGRIFRWKLAWGGLVSVVTGIVSGALILYHLRFVSGVLGLEPGDMWASVRSFWNAALEEWPWWVMVAGVALVILFLIANLSYLYFSATAGAAEPLNQHGIAGPIVVGVFTYLAQQLLFLGAIIAIPYGVEFLDGGLAISNVNWLSEITANSSPSGMPIGFVVIYPIVIAVLVTWCNRIWQKRISLA